MPDIGSALVEANAISAQQLNEAKASGGDSLAAALVEGRMVDEREFVSVIARAFDAPEADLGNASPDAEALALIPETLYKSSGCLPLKKDGAMLEVATADPGNDRSIDRLARTTGLSIKVLVAGPRELDKAASKFYGTSIERAKPKKSPADLGPPLKELDAGLKNAVQEMTTDEVEEEDLHGAVRLEINDLDPPVVRIVNGILLKSLKMGAKPTLSPTDRCGNSCSSWNTMPTDRRWVGSAVTSTPSSKTLPASGRPARRSPGAACSCRCPTARAAPRPRRRARRANTRRAR